MRKDTVRDLVAKAAMEVDGREIKGHAVRAGYAYSNDVTLGLVDGFGVLHLWTNEHLLDETGFWQARHIVMWKSLPLRK